MAAASAPINLGAGSLKDTVGDEFHGQVQPVWPPRVGRTASGRSPLDDAGQHRSVERLDVGGVGHLRVRSMIVAGLELARITRYPSARSTRQGLGPGIVELAGLADDDGSGADYQDRLDVVTPGHGIGLPGSDSSGHAAAAAAVHHLGEIGEVVPAVMGPPVRPRGGTGRRRRGSPSTAMPSRASSLRHRWVSVTFGTDPASTAKLWFWLVISMRPVAVQRTGTLPPWWPKRILKVRPARATVPAAGGPGRSRTPGPRRRGSATPRPPGRPVPGRPVRC